ncbi:MAG: hypothetical protein PHN69_08230 [Candidatus Pacebacteria bacterium]|nr:hypothetical protein [Candidatus Paceibacterota bacterium]
MDFNDKPTFSTPALTAEVAQEIYSLIKQYGSADRAYKLKGNSNYEPEHFDLVNKEADRIVRELREYKNGNVILEAAIPAVYDEEGNVTSDAIPAVMYEYTTDADLIEQISSDYLDVATIYNDLVK